MQRSGHVGWSIASFVHDPPPPSLLPLPAVSFILGPSLSSQWPAAVTLLRLPSAVFWFPLLQRPMIDMQSRGGPAQHVTLEERYKCSNHNVHSCMLLFNIVVYVNEPVSPVTQVC
jgi:hypothetical protein